MCIYQQQQIMYTNSEFNLHFFFFIKETVCERNKCLNRKLIPEKKKVDFILSLAFIKAY